MASKGDINKCHKTYRAICQPPPGKKKKKKNVNRLINMEHFEMYALSEFIFILC